MLAHFLQYFEKLGHLVHNSYCCLTVSCNCALYLISSGLYIEENKQDIERLDIIFGGIFGPSAGQAFVT